MKRSFNFSAGPAAIPEPVLLKAQAELLDYRDQGVSIMEMSHRSDLFMEIVEQAETDLRYLMNIPSDYSILMLHGGASTQFATIPMNFIQPGGQADYVCTGIWSKKAIKEAQKFGDIGIAATSEAANFTYAPPADEWKLRRGSAYVHYTPNETIQGVEYLELPQLPSEFSVVADMSSTILSRPIDVSRFDLIYAGAQKNIGPAGITAVIIHKRLLERACQGKAAEDVPTILNYQTHVKHGSMFNTPPTFSWYLSGLVFQWLREQGGLEKMATVNRRKSEMLYRCIDESDFYSNPVAIESRSWMNIPFILASSDLDGAFLAGANERGLLNLKGHRSVGGMRASIYNAVPESAVVALIEYMREFEKERA